MAKTFQKRPGTTDQGRDYETFNIANVVMDLVVDENFHISSNDAAFGDFDDVVVETETKNGTEIYAFQLKHSGRGPLSLEQLKQKTGNFSVKKYFDSAKTLTVANTNFLLYTNLKFEAAEGTQLCLDNENFPITLTKISSNNAFKISQKTDYCYKFSIVPDGRFEDPKKVSLYEKFFETFFLYTDQQNLTELKRNVSEKFKAYFCASDVECNEYVNFLSEWSLRDGRKEKLNKKWMKLVIALKILSSRVKPLSFNHINEDVKTVMQDVNIVRRNILCEAISVFDITIFAKQCYDDVKILWDDINCGPEDLKTINQLRKDYQLAPTYISDLAKVDSRTLSILFWLWGKCPLVLTEEVNVHEAIKLCVGAKFILLKDDFDNSLTKNFRVFQTLSDLTPKTSLYNNVISEFTCSLQGKKEIPLHDLIKANEKILKLLTTDDLLEALKGQCLIGEKREHLPEPYIERCLLKNAIDFKILDNITDKTVVILDSVSESDELKYKLKRHKLTNVRDYLHENQQTPANESSFEILDVAATICVSEEPCAFREFDAVCNKTQNFENVHQFRVRDDGNLEWIRSRGDVNDVEKYKLPENYKLQERDFGFSKCENNINLLISDSGMGKSELMKSFKIRGFSDRFTVIIEPKDVDSFVKSTCYASNVDGFRAFLSNEKHNVFSERDKAVFKIFLEENKIVYIWDALDELSEKNVDIIANIILELSKTCVQWVTSRCHLQYTLQRKFSVMSLNLSKFDEDEQSNYIRNRLANVSLTEEVETITKKIQSSFVLVEHRDILGIPLQLFMLTELFRQDQQKYLALLDDFFLLTDLYKYFIDEKINIYHREKLCINVDGAEGLVQAQKTKLFAEYTKAALRLLFQDTTFPKLVVQNTDDFEDVRESHTNTGLVSEIKNQTPRFLHNSFAEYLAARYFADNLRHQKILERVLFDQKYNNVRFFFDLILARGSQAHVAILYKNFSFLKTCNGYDLQTPDSGGRTVLHLACSWGQRYPELTVEHKLLRRTYNIHDEGMFKIVTESNAYLETLDFLLTMNDVSQSDKIYNMTAGEYARETTCLVAEMRYMMRQTTGLSLQTEHLINMLYYSACCGYYDEFKYVFECFINGTIFRRIIDNVRNKTEKTLLYIANLMGHAKIVEFLITEGADIGLAGQPLTTASMNGNYEIVEFIVKAGADINLADQNGNTPLNLAASNGHEKIVKLLVKAGAKINVPNNNGETPLQAALVDGHYTIVEFLLESGADIKLLNTNGFSLHAASKMGSYSIVKFLVETGVNINLANKDGDTPLQLASATGQHKIVEFLVEAGADVNVANKNDETPLHLALVKGYYEIVEFLLQVDADSNLLNKNSYTLHAPSEIGSYKTVQLLVKIGADINLVNEDGDTPLHLASSKGHHEIVEFLLKSGASSDIKNCYNETPLLLSSSHGHEKVVELLADAGANINLVGEYDQTPLLLASRNGHYKTVAYLLKAGADVNHENLDESPLGEASKEGRVEVVELLVESRADVNRRGLSARSPLANAASGDHCGVVAVLVGAGADVNLADWGGSTALHLAAFRGFAACVELLIEAGADVDLVDEDGNTPPKIAVKQGHVEIVQLFMEEDAKLGRSLR